MLKTVSNIIFDLFDKNYFFAKSILEMIIKDDKFNCYILKSKTVFKTFFRTLSKFAKQVKIRLNNNFKRSILKEKIFYLKFCYCCATQTCHRFQMCCIGAFLKSVTGLCDAADRLWHSKITKKKNFLNILLI